MLFERAAVIGIGLIGGSFALATRRRGLVGAVVGVARRQATLDQASTLGLADEVTTDPASAVAEADLVYLATPVSSICSLLQEIRPSLRAGCTVTDAGSTKRQIVHFGGQLPAEVSFVGGHPLAGSEQSGPAAAREDLFEGAVYFLTPTANSPPEAIQRLAQLVEGLGARPVLLDAVEHDRLLAATSHLPHLVAAALCHALGHVRDVATYGGSGLRDTTRVASGPAEVWRDIMLSNADELLSALDGLSEAIEEFRGALRTRDGERLSQLLNFARQVRGRMERPCSD